MVRKMNDTSDKRMEYGEWRGKMFSWIAKNKPNYIEQSQKQVPRCSIHLFRLVQYAEMLQIDRTQPTEQLLTQLRGFEQKWDALRQEHLAWKNVTDIPDINFPTESPTYHKSKCWVN